MRAPRLTLVYAVYRLRMLRGAALLRPGRAAAVALGVALALLALAHGGDQAARLLEDLGLGPREVLAWLVAGAVALGAALALAGLVATLFEPARADELERLAALPVGKPALFGFLLVDQLPALALTLYLAAPLAALVVRQSGLGPLAWLALMGALGLCVVQVICLLIVLAALIVRGLPGALLRVRGVLGALALLPLLAAGAALASGARAEALGQLPQTTWVAELLDGLLGRPALVWRAAGSLVAATVACAVVAEWVHGRVLVDGLSGVAGKLQRRAPVRGGAAPVVGASTVEGALVEDMGAAQVGGLLGLEWRASTRDRGLALAWAIGGVIAALPAAMLFAAPAEQLPVYAAAYWCAVGWAGFNALALPALSALARDGRDLGALAWLPVPEDRVLAARAAFHAVPGLAWAAVWAGLLAGAAGTGWGPALGLWAGAALFGAGLAGVAVTVGAVFVGGGPRGVSALGLAVFAMLQLLLLATCAALVGATRLGGTAWVAWGAALLAWGVAGSVLRGEALRALRRRRRIDAGP